MIFDAKGIDYNDFSSSTFVIKISSGTKTSLAHFINEIFDYFKQRKDAIQRGERVPYVIVIIDDYEGTMLGEIGQSKMLNLIRESPRVGMFFYLVTTNITTEAIPTEIKSLIPSRIAFRVTSKHISRLLLDQNGAEELKVPGEIIVKDIYSTQKVDCIYLENHDIRRYLYKKAMVFNSAPKKVSSEEIIKKLHFIAKDLHQYSNKNENTELEYQEPQKIDPLYYDVLEYVKNQNKINTSLLQRKFKTGYNRTSNILSLLQKNGVVGPLEHGFREVLVRRDISAKKIVNAEENETRLSQTPSIVHLRPFPYTEVKGGAFEVKNDEIHLYKKTTIKRQSATLTLEFNGEAVVKLILKKPSILYLGLMRFELKDDSKVSPDLMAKKYFSYKEMVNNVELDFTKTETDVVSLFMEQLSQDLGLEITN